MIYTEVNAISIEHRQKYLLWSIVCLLIGSLIYCIFRNEVFFLNIINVSIETDFVLPPSYLTQFVLYNLSDLLWALALMLFLCTQTNRIIKLCGLIIPIVMESIQLLDDFPGTFDKIDLLIYCLTSLYFFIKWKLKKEL